jgi:hypothetical protein
MTKYDAAVMAIQLRDASTQLAALFFNLAVIYTSIFTIIFLTIKLWTLLSKTETETEQSIYPTE